MKYKEFRKLFLNDDIYIRGIFKFYFSNTDKDDSILGKITNIIFYPVDLRNSYYFISILDGNTIKFFKSSQIMAISRDNYFIYKSKNFKGDTSSKV